jgi:thioesterase domain-containing protein
MYQAAERVANSMVIPGQPSITLTGHSLGGAMALLIGDLLLHRGFNVVKIVTFGTPQVGKIAAFNTRSSKANTIVRQYRYGNDIVTRLGLLQHPSKQIQLGKPSWFPSIKDHNLHNYIRQLDKQFY